MAEQQNKDKQPQTNVRAMQTAAHVAEPNFVPTLGVPLSTYTIQRIQQAPSRITPTDVLALQRTIGNREVAQLLRRTPLSEHRTGSKSNTSTLKSSPPSALQRASFAGPSGGEVDNALATRIREAQSGGSSLPTTVRRTLEPKLGADLSGVKVHTGNKAVQLSRELGAKAFTHKQHIFYGAGQSPNDLQLTAHEAVHTIQQGAAPLSGATKMPGLQRTTHTIQRKKERNEQKADPNKVKEDLPKDADKFTLTLGVWRKDDKFLWKSTKYVIKKAFAKLFRREKPDAPGETGHSWVELRAYKEGKLVFADSYGFMKGGVRHPDPFHGDKSKDNDTLYKDYEISKDRFANVIATAETIAKEKPEYHTLEMNCTTFARMLVRAAGLKFIGNRVVPGAKVGPGKAFTPNRLYSALRRQQKKGKAYDLKEDRKDFRSKEPEPQKLQVSDFVPDEALAYFETGSYEWARPYLDPDFYNKLTDEQKEVLADHLKLELTEFNRIFSAINWSDIDS